jgi:2,3-bisphosphoglycerate-independent phosphoglycerate mutase
LPWKNGDFIFININKIDKFGNHFNDVNLKYVGKIKDFDPNKIFVEYMLSMRFNNSFMLILRGG